MLANLSRSGFAADRRLLQTAKRLGRFAEPFQNSRLRLQGLYVLCLPALRAFYDAELHRLAFLKAAEAAVRLDRREMHEDVFAILTADESETLGIVKPLHCSLFHFVTFFFVLDFLLRRLLEGGVTLR
jgi:hypothetical protein